VWLLAIVLMEHAALAQSTPTAGTLVIVRTARDAAIVMRVRTELATSAFEIVEIEAEPSTARAALSQLAAEHGASAVMRVRSEPTSIELWSRSAQSAEHGTIDLITVPDGETHGDEVLALRAVETLRARALALLPPPSARPAEPEPEPDPEPEPSAPAAQPAPQTEEDALEPAQAFTPEAPEAAAPVTPQLWLELAPAVVLSPGGLGPQLGGLVSARAQLSAQVSIAGLAVVPLWRAELEADEGRARVATWLLGAAIDAHARLRAWELSGGAGIASALTPMSGSAAAPFEGVDQLETSAAPFLRGSLQLELGGSLRACLRALIGFALPEVAVSFEERDVASWGRPFALLSLGVELPLAPL
jgi:hypothetical protein